MPRFVPAASDTASTTVWKQPFGSTSQSATAVWLHVAGNVYLNTTNSDTGRGYLSAGTYNLGPVDPSTVWVLAVSTASNLSGYYVTQ